VAAGLLLGVVSSSYQRSNADPPATTAAVDDSANADTVAQLKEINAQLKELNAHLQKGVTRVFVMMNPPQ
jgi:multidrug efflux pump subunit AcrB